MALNILAEAILRVEHKLDALLNKFQVYVPAMHFVGQSCPACGQTIDYQIDFQHQVVTRRCGCKTGKFPSTIPLNPVGAPDGSQAESRRTSARSGPAAGSDPVPASPNRSRNQGR